MDKSYTLLERGESNREHGIKRVSPTPKEDEFQEGDGEQADWDPEREEKTKHKRVSIRKGFPGGLGESWFHSKSCQI